MSLLAEIPKTWVEANVETGKTDLLARYGELSGLTGTIINAVFWVGIALALAFGIISGIKYATSGGDKMQAQAAKQGVTSAIIGFIIVVAFRTIILIVLKLLGVGDPTLPATVY